MVPKLRLITFAPSIRRPGDPIGNGRSQTGAGRIQGLHGHELNLPTDSGRPRSIVAHGPNSSRDVRAMTVVIHRIICTCFKIVAVNVGRWSGPHIGGKILVFVIDSGVDDRDDDGAAVRNVIPSPLHTHVQAPRSQVLSGIWDRWGSCRRGGRRHDLSGVGHVPLLGIIGLFL